MGLKETIVHEAQKLFSLNGFLNTGIRDIMAAAGTSRGGFCDYFCSKEDHFREVLAESQKIWRSKVLFGLDQIDSPTQKIVQILTNYGQRYLKDAENFPGGCIFISLSVELDDTRPHLAQAVHQGFEGFKALLKRLLDEAVQFGELPTNLNTTTVTEMLFTGMLGASVLYGVNKSAAALDRSIESLVEYLELLGNRRVLRRFDNDVERRMAGDLALSPTADRVDKAGVNG
jgi:AcrR family transcriptional regulator